MTDIADQWLGRGTRFPFRPGTSGGLDYLEGMDLIRQSVGVILDTEPGERIMLPAFGCGLRRFIMQPNTLSVRTTMAQEVSTALGLWEPRIQLDRVEVTAGDEPSLAWIDIAYRRRSDNRPDNLVFPFYLR